MVTESGGSGTGGKAATKEAKVASATNSTTASTASATSKSSEKDTASEDKARAAGAGATVTNGDKVDASQVLAETIASVEASGGAEAENMPTVNLWALQLAVPAKNLLSCYLLGPVLLGECKSERTCVPWINLILLIADIVVFSGHLFLGIKWRAYRMRVPMYNFYILLVFWSTWNLCSHPLCRQHLVDLFVTPPEIHVTINIAAIAVCSSTIMAQPSMRHLIGLVTCEFLISLVLSSIEFLVSLMLTSIEVLNFHMDSGWLAAVRLDIVMFNVAILLIGSTIIIGTMTVEKDIKSLAHEMEARLGPSGCFEDDLERRKRAVLTALCDAVLTTGSTFQVTGSDEGADRVFRRPMLNEILTDYFKDQAEKEKFLAAVKKQFPEDDSVGEGPKRMRMTLRDDSGEPFEADIVVSDASTDESGKVNKYMVGMHIRGEFRNRQRTGGAVTDKRHGSAADADRENHRESKREKGEPLGEDRNHSRVYDELSRELLAAFDGVLMQPCEATAPASGDQADHPRQGEADGDDGGGIGESLDTGEPLRDADGGEGSPAAVGPPRFFLRRATCEVFRRRLGARAGERHVDLRRLSLPEPSAAGLT